MKRVSFVFGVLILSLLLITGCGGDKQEPAAEDQTKQIFSFACSGAYDPFSFYDEKTNELTGFDVEIGIALAEKMGMKPMPQSAPWQSLITGLKAERYDAIIGSMTITEERLKEVDFTDPYYVSGPKLFVRKDSAIKSVDDLKQDTAIGVLSSSVYEELAKKYSSNLKFYDSDVTALRDLAQGRSEAVITDQNVGVITANKANLDVVAVGDLLMVENIGIAVRKGSPLREKLNQALKDIKADGTYLKICEKYVGMDISGDK
ncbi:MAG: transporter substrate-binding domain-containing protein [Bacillota bacterium]|uniref:transporter substrate-binding domain-containing protein n=1 Tax=unclassified Candidatus Desulforudis TaxID=2635950 RepID=UPI003BCC5F22